MSVFTLKAVRANDTVTAGECLSLTLEREIYTPYETLTGLFLTDAASDFRGVVYLELEWQGQSIFTGLADRVEKFQRGGVWMLRVQSRTFTSLLTQNELEAGLHSNLTLETLVNGFYTIPHVTVEQNPTTGYIFVKEGTSLWDCVATFVYKVSRRYPFVNNNMVRMTLDAVPTVWTPDSSRIVETGQVTDTTKLVSHYHMEDLQGNPDAYREENPTATAAQIVRHKQLPFDRQFLSDPQKALTFRNLFSCRGNRAAYVTYAGFANEKLGDTVRCGTLLPDKTICRVRMTFGTQGLRTSLWAYEDGFYNQCQQL